MLCKIGICDDMESERAYLSELVRKWATVNGHEARVSCFHSAESFLFAYADEQDYDILLLDIEMGAMDGVTMAKKLRRDNDAVQIIFVTGYSDYIAEGYEVAALHYLMKPVSQETLFTVLDRAAQKLRRNEKSLTLESGGTLVRIPIYQIRYADVQGNYVTIHGKEDHTVKMPLGELEKQLDDRFHRAGRSAIVNLTCISRVTRTDIFLNDGTVLPLPRGAYEPLNRAIIAHT